LAKRGPRPQAGGPEEKTMGPEPAAVAIAEVQKLLDAGFIRECQYPEWISYVVLVKKPNGS